MCLFVRGVCPNQHPSLLRKTRDYSMVSKQNFRMSSNCVKTFYFESNDYSDAFKYQIPWHTMITCSSIEPIRLATVLYTEFRIMRTWNERMPYVFVSTIKFDMPKNFDGFQKNKRKKKPNNKPNRPKSM